MTKKTLPPTIALKFFRWYCHPRLLDRIEGDLLEVYGERVNKLGRRRADIRFIVDVILLFRRKIIRPVEGYRNLNTYGMYKSYFKISWRNLVKNKGYSFINIAGLTAGMTVAILIGLWVWDELSFDRNFANYNTIAQVWQFNTANGIVSAEKAMPYVTAEEIRNTYGSDFKYVVQSTWTDSRTLTRGDVMLIKSGNYIEPAATEMLSLKMLSGTRDGLKDPHSVLLSASTARALFGETDPMNQAMRVGRLADVKVTGVYEDFPANSSFSNVDYLLPWELFVILSPWLKEMDDPWSGNFTQTFVQIADHADMEAVSLKIRDLKMKKVKAAEDRNQKPEVFLHPMSRWHLYSQFENGKNTGGRIAFVWLFGSVGAFVLLLACINFMNLSTARSEKRAKEVGIRKSIGSLKSQLVAQFFTESVVLALAAFVLALVCAQVIVPPFNHVAGKNLEIPWSSAYFWLACVAFALFTGLVAGSYPALFLSSFQPVRVLTNKLTSGSGATPRKVLVVLQFTVSGILIVGTIVVYLQVQFAKQRFVGYDRAGLINVRGSVGVHENFDAARKELVESGAIVEMAESGSMLTLVNNNNSGFDWRGKDPGLGVEFANTDVSLDFGKTIGWKIVAGRDFSPEFKSDTAAFIINEAAARYTGLHDPVGETITWNNKPFKVIGIVEDVVMESPYEPVRPSLFFMTRDVGNQVLVRLNPLTDTHESVRKVEAVFRKYNASAPFDYHFVDQAYAVKFGDEERTGTLSGIFSGLAIFISCLGIFGLAAFTAEQRTKEIGVRKVMGATVFSVWKLLSGDFIVLTLVSFVISVPVAYLFMNRWLHEFKYHTEIKWWAFAVTGIGILLITLLTVSYQAVKAARMNPVNSLRSE